MTRAEQHGTGQAVLLRRDTSAGTATGVSLVLGSCLMFQVSDQIRLALRPRGEPGFGECISVRMRSPTSAGDAYVKSLSRGD